MHTLASYFREQGAHVATLRAGLPAAALDEFAPDLVVLSPGPGRPSDFACDDLLAELDARGLAAFGVCLGLQAMVEHAGGDLGLLPEPVHGKPGLVLRTAAGLPRPGAGAHGWVARRARWMDCRRSSPRPGITRCMRCRSQVKGGFEVTAVTPDGVVMAIEDDAAGRWAVQFHPESILTASGGVGHQVVANVLRLCRARAARTASRQAVGRSR